MAKSPAGSARKLRQWLVGGACLLLLAAAARHALFLAVERDAFEPKQAGSADAVTPDRLGAPSRQFAFSSGARTLRGSCVLAQAAEAPAVLIYHGDEENLSDWASAQALLYRNGISSCVFDYSGYGASDGKPGVVNLHEDGVAAYGQFLAATPLSSRRYVMGFSLGSAVLLDVISTLRPAPDGLVIAAGFTSAREAAVVTGRVPVWLARLLPEPWDNEMHLHHLQLPLLLVHSRADEVIPFAHAERLERAAAGARRLVALPALPHDAAIEPERQDAFWAPIIAYLRSGLLPAPGPD
ncbi:alpha/beta hydrolase [Cupriavidus basilensis]|uniref:alpha/beta hydrolase n=1 Tax=Cupriavidus basilensis TaxID=68895 RepID=UPI0023E817B2|nr:alpha/beta hydrolase [Cupriavidus basilensis]MDF3882788.1 alpha/beta hydrolase [Cupriavidus basilensis]